MILLLDHLLAIVVGSVLGIVIFTTAMRVQSLNHEANTTYAMRRLSSDMATWMEDDVLSIGRNMPLNQIPYANPVDSAGLTKTFTFYRDSVSVVGGVSTVNRINTQYRLRYAGTRGSGAEAYNIYRVDRYVQVDGGAWNFDGSAPPYLKHFKIEMLDRDAKPIADPVAAFGIDPNTVRNTGIRFTLATPHEQRGLALQSVHFASTLMIPYRQN